MTLIRCLLPGVSLSAVPPARAADLTVFAAASLADVMDEIGPAFAAETGTPVRFSFAGSGVLVRQIEEGAPADAIISADERQLDRLEKAGCLLQGSRRIVVGNTLVVVVGMDTTWHLARVEDLAGSDVRRIGIGEVSTVPAGGYAKGFLEGAGLWAAVAGRTVPLENVRAVLAAVAAGDVDAGFVYKSDALTSKRVRIEIEIPAGPESRIVYPAAVVAASPRTAAARRFLEWLRGQRAREMFERRGFKALE